LFPTEYQEKVFREEAHKIAFFDLFAAQQDAAVSQAADKTAAYRDFFAKRLAEIEAKPLHDGFVRDELDAALARHKTALEGDLQQLVKSFQVEAHVDRAQLAELAIRTLLTDPAEFMASTGVVIAGFADHDYFPRFSNNPRQSYLDAAGAKGRLTGHPRPHQGFRNDRYGQHISGRRKS